LDRDSKLKFVWQCHALHIGRVRCHTRWHAEGLLERTARSYRPRQHRDSTRKESTDPSGIHPAEVARQLIERLTGVRHHPAHVWALLRYRLGWSLQRPRRRAAERNQAAVDHWVNVDWPRIKKRQAPRCGDLLEYRASSGAPRSVTRHAEW
jgi:transposase